MCDARGLAQFLNAIGEMAQGADSPSIPPVWARELLNARDPPTITRPHYEYDQLLDSQGSFIAAIDQSNMAQRSFHFSPQQIRALRKHLPPHLSTRSSFELITACVWKCRTLSLRLNPTDTVRISCAVNARGKRFNDLCLPLGFYGNAFGIPTVVSTAELLCASPLGYGVELVRKSKAQMDKEYNVLSTCNHWLIFSVIRGWPPFPMGWNVFAVSDNRHTGLGEFDVGWGRPLFAGLARVVSVISFYVRDNNQEEEFGTLVPICLPSTCLERFEEELKKMTLEHVEEISK
ncbi:methanol O-anthraniloyltransferase-like [Prunus yedoensis var. nudiflora]|uniref:Methanol O-anthraniloyltransferase-like n=1 Tax=Prunus yedoensis var. nudiflora TaxID=2094558 RepID=A0A314YVE6_PRUYE|nr:methanol O-anthraniloyltransferase-like [Prunus yedoensis var. nudiflora]